jgi:hypothetical protein
MKVIFVMGRSLVVKRIQMQLGLIARLYIVIIRAFRQFCHGDGFEAKYKLATEQERRDETKGNSFTPSDLTFSSKSTPLVLPQRMILARGPVSLYEYVQ